MVIQTARHKTQRVTCYDFLILCWQKLDSSWLTAQAANNHGFGNGVWQQPAIVAKAPQYRTYFKRVSPNFGHSGVV